MWSSGGQLNTLTFYLSLRGKEIISCHIFWGRNKWELRNRIHCKFPKSNYRKPWINDGTFRCRNVPNVDTDHASRSKSQQSVFFWASLSAAVARCPKYILLMLPLLISYFHLSGRSRKYFQAAVHSICVCVCAVLYAKRLRNGIVAVIFLAKSPCLLFYRCDGGLYDKRSAQTAAFFGAFSRIDPYS